MCAGLKDNGSQYPTQYITVETHTARAAIASPGLWIHSQQSGTYSNLIIFIISGKIYQL